MHWVLEANLPILSVSNGLTSDVNFEFWVLGTIYYYEFIMNLIARLCHFARKFILKVKNYSHITKTSPLHKRNGVKFLFLVEKHQELLGEFFLPLQHRTWTNAYKGTVLSNFFKTCLNLKVFNLGSGAVFQMEHSQMYFLEYRGETVKSINSRLRDNIIIW